MDDFLNLENRHTGEILRMRRERDAEGQVLLALDGSLPPRKDGPPPHVHFRQREEGKVRAGSLGVQVGSEKGVVPAGGTAAFPAKASSILGGTLGTIQWSLAGMRFRLRTWIATSRRYLLS